jgi:hypothetical protein
MKVRPGLRGGNGQRPGRFLAGGAKGGNPASKSGST